MGRGGGGALNGVASTVDSALSGVFGAWARIVARQPLPFIPACVLFALIAGANNVRMFATLEIRPSKMFCPPDSPAIPQARVMQDNFDAAKRVESFIVTAGGEDMLLQANLLRAMEVMERLETMQTEAVAPSFPAGLPPQRWDLPQLCLKSYGEQCAIVSVLNLWGRNSTTLRAQTQEQIYAAVNAPATRGFPRFPPMEDLLGDLRYGPDGTIVSAGAVQTVMLLEYRADPEVAEAGIMVAPWTDEPSEAWEDLMIATMQEPGMEDCTFNTQKSQASEYVLSALSDLGKLGLGYALVFGCKNHRVIISSVFCSCWSPFPCRSSN